MMRPCQPVKSDALRGLRGGSYSVLLLTPRLPVLRARGREQTKTPDETARARGRVFRVLGASAAVFFRPELFVGAR